MHCRMAAVRLEHCTDLESPDYDAIVLVAPHHQVSLTEPIQYQYSYILLHKMLFPSGGDPNLNLNLNPEF